MYYGLGVTEHSQGSTTVMGIANPRHAHRQHRPARRRREPLRGQNNVQGSCDMGSFPHELPGYRHVKNAETRAVFETRWGVEIDPEPGLRIPNMLDAAVDGTFRGLYVQGEDILQSDPDTKHVAAGLAAMDCVIVHDLFLNETANYAHVFLPGSTFLEKDGTFTNAERRINMVRRVMAPRNGLADWEVTQGLANAMGAGWSYTHPSQIMDEIAETTPSFAGVSYDLSTGSARCNGPATTPPPRARRSCMWAASCAARAGSSSRNTSRPTKRPGRASRSCSPPAASSRSTTSAPRQGAPPTTSGMIRTCSRSTPTTPNSAA
ncbi:MAG: molybdopterin-dependent oxidoreductase [Paracoccaceae bacterium]